MTLNQYLSSIVDWLKQQLIKAHADGLLVAFSGGIDSAVVALLAAKAAPHNHKLIFLDLNSSALDRDCVQVFMATTKLTVSSYNLNPIFDRLEQAVFATDQSLPTPAAANNAKARLRMTMSYTIAQTNNYLVVGTTNADEWYLGYFTKYGDGGVDLEPLFHLNKAQVYQAAEILGVPQKIIDRAPTASLALNQTDESELGFSYDQLNQFLNHQLQDQTIGKQIEQWHFKTEHKRQPIPHPPIWKK